MQRYYYRPHGEHATLCIPVAVVAMAMNMPGVGAVVPWSVFMAVIESEEEPETEERAKKRGGG